MTDFRPAGDPQIRAQLVSEIRPLHPHARIVHEVATGASRIDVAMIAEKLSGFEIKSWRDSLTRLEQQARDYSRICDICCLVATPRHMDAASLIVPEWWGLLLVLQTDEKITLSPQRNMQGNPSIDVKRLASLLWRDEMLAILAENHIAKRLASKPRRALIEVLHSEVPLPDLRVSILRTIKTRANWRTERAA